MVTRSGRLASQQPRELARFIQILKNRGVQSYLEVGVRHGDTFFEVVRSLPEGSRAVAIDLPNGPWGGNSRRYLESAVDELCAIGYNASAIFGDSHEVVVHGRFDAVLIDGDHRYEGVKSDFGRFGNATIVAFHDIDGEGIMCGGMPVEVPRFWREVKQGRQFEEIIDPSDDRRMGIGVIYEEGCDCLR